MDLVDIDKVLDSLELNEESKDEISIKSHSENKLLYVEEIKKPEYVNAVTSKSTSERFNPFAGVSQMLSSLDDYCKHVECLETGIDLLKINRSNQEYVHTSSEAVSNIEHFLRNNETNNLVGNEDTCENARGHEHELSSTSITTSSSSSISSGPSLALFSIESVSSLENVLVESDAFKAGKSPQYELDEMRQAEFVDLTTGLSSVSLANSQSVIFSGDNNTQYLLKRRDLDSSVSSRKSNLYMNLENETQQHDQSVTKDIGKGDPELVIPESTGVQYSSHQTLIATYGSTMDEVSDTELDSILPEIELEESLHLEPMECSNNITCMQLSPKIENKIGIEALSITSRKINDTLNDINAASINDSYRKNTRDENKFVNGKDASEICIVELNARQPSPRKQRPTTLDLPVRKIDLYATAGQTPPGTRTYERTTSSSDEDTPDEPAIFYSDVENNNSNDTNCHSSESGITEFNGDSFISTKKSNSIPRNIDSAEMPQALDSINTNVNQNLGKVPPVWVPDTEANSCMQCQQKFTLIKRRHHCRACGHVLCSICCSQKFKLEFLSNPESRVCIKCFLLLTGMQQEMEQSVTGVASTGETRTPNPNNPMEYCSTVPPHRQVNTDVVSYPAVIVPVGVLKKENNSKICRMRKSVVFSDGIRPGSDLANQSDLDGRWGDTKYSCKPVLLKNATKESDNTPAIVKTLRAHTKKTIAENIGNFIPASENTLPPICISNKPDQVFQEVINNADLIKRLHSESLKFAIQRNFHVFVKISHLKCCINKTVINFTTSGLHHVGNDEIIILLELNNSNELPKDVFVHLNEIYCQASKGHPINELGFSMANESFFLGSRQHGGFLFIRSTYQCLQDVHVPSSPFLIGILIHRCEIPWAKIFPLRLMLRLGAQYRYYPSPHISVREREPVYADIAQTIINLLADFRNYTYTLPTIKGMFIHMEDRRTNILIPRNRHDEIMSAIKNSSDHILAMGANFSKKADGHLVCIQNIDPANTDSHSYSTQAINIQGQPRKVTGASFFILNEALKTTSGLSGKCSIVEDGLMVQILPAKMAKVKDALVNMQNIDIICGPIEARDQQTEIVCVQWVEEDTEINIGVRSPIDLKKMDGMPSIRVHSGVNLRNNNHILKWTEVFILESNENRSLGKYSATDISKISEVIAKNTTIALHPFLDLLAANGYNKIGLRVTLNQDRVCFEAGSQGEKLPPLYMNALDLELIPTLHKQAIEMGKMYILELIFYILNP